MLLDRLLDVSLIAVYLITITAFGARFRRSQKSLQDYFLGGKSAPWWAISLSIVAAETSTLTIIGTPALAFGGNLGFLQLVMGYLVGRLVISVVFIPRYFRGRMFTAYELMRERFGERVRRLTAATFLVTRSLAEGVRVFAISLVVSVVLDTGEFASIVIISLLTLFYTFEGGMKAVIWTDVVQMVLYVSGAVLSFVLILDEIPGGWDTVSRTASAAGKFQVFDFGFEPTREFFSRTYTFWAGLLGGAFLTTATHGTDQLFVQRLLSAKTERDSRLALLSSWIVIAFQFTLFLVIGVTLYVLHQSAGTAPPEPLDRLYPEFVWTHLPTPAAGIVVAAILAAAMSNLSAALNSLASATVMDFYIPLFGRSGFDKSRLGQPRISEDRITERQYLKLSRRVTLFWGAVLIGIAVLAREWGSVLEAGLAIASVPLGALLGVFGLGVLTRRVRENDAIAAWVIGLAVILYVTFGTTVAWTWYVVIGATTTFASGYAASLLGAKSKPLSP